MSRSSLIRNLVNIPGLRTNRKIVIIESDDWGSIRMPSKEAFQSLIKAGIRVDLSKYNTYDSLERRSDLEELIGLIESYKNRVGQKPVFTLNTVMGNPDFKKIKNEHFQNYYFEHFFQSYQNYYGEDLSLIWEKGIKNGAISPQFHAREHLNTPLWLKDLQQNNIETRLAFDNKFFGLKTKTSSPFQSHYLFAYFANTKEDFNKLKEAVSDGLALFEKTFGYPSKSFVACNYIFPKQLEETLSVHGIKTVQTQRGHSSVDINTGRVKTKYRYTGQKGRFGLIYTVRNVIFEPSLDQNKDWVDSALAEIKNAFYWGKPAIISSHRINYVSNMSIKNRDRGLFSLEKLLGEIIKYYPEVEFMTSAKFSSILMQK